MQNARKACLFLTLLVLTPFCAASYVPPTAFTNLYFDFTGENTPQYPKGKINIAQLLLQSEAKRNTKLNQQMGQLILFVDSNLYVYDANRNQLANITMRTKPDSGFLEMTAISHIGPALMYLVKIKEGGSNAWISQLKNLLQDVIAVKAINQQKKNNWLAKVNAPAWKTYQQSIHNMVNYACNMTESYINNVLTGEKPFSMMSLQQDFLEGNVNYPTPFNNIMIATFMLTVLQSLTDIHDQLSKIKINWPDAKVLIRFVAGKNVTAGLSAGSNWIVPFVKALSNYTIPDDHIYIAAYAAVKPSLGQVQLTKADYEYYNNIWQSVYNRTHLAKAVFANITSLFVPSRPALPGDYAFSKANDINDFLMRLKFSLAQPTEMLSNTVGFWMPEELASKKWDAARVEIPGLSAFV